jgi:hypothetical protein
MSLSFLLHGGHGNVEIWAAESSGRGHYIFFSNLCSVVLGRLKAMKPKQPSWAK